MKTLLIIITSALVSIFAFASEPDMVSSGRADILQDTKDLVKVCAVMILSQEKDNVLVRNFESHCETLELVSQTEARILIGNEWFTATITTSEDSDEGDLNNMELRNSAGQLVAARYNVPAFENIVLAMTGGDQDLEVRIVPR